MTLPYISSGFPTLVLDANFIVHCGDIHRSKDSIVKIRKSYVNEFHYKQSELMSRMRIVQSGVVRSCTHL
jgi:hypothetical protein